MLKNKILHLYGSDISLFAIGNYFKWGKCVYVHEREKQHIVITVTRVIETTSAPDDTFAQPTCECEGVIASTGCSNNQVICQALNEFRSLQTFGVPVTQLTLFIATWEADKGK